MNNQNKNQQQNEQKTQEYLDELAFLAETAGAEVVKTFTQKLDCPNSVTYVGKGKLQEIREYIELCAEEPEEDEFGNIPESQEIGMVIFDDELSAKQLRNIEAELKVKILDRTSLILDIFAMRAQTANAKTQVELAQYKYMLPRLTRLWTHLERQGGGSGAGGGKGSVGLRGPGETQLEMDRRIILNRMSLLKKQLAEMKKDYDPSEYGGAPILGISKPVIKAHGSSDAKAFKNAIRQAINYADSGAIYDIAAAAKAYAERRKAEQERKKQETTEL